LFRYIFRILLLLPIIGNAQVIDGKTYTPFNNYYKWRGGAFDTTLLIPQVASPNGKRPGSIYYNTSDSSVYSWSGSQWRIVSGDTTSLSNRINLKLNISDTLSMLNPYRFTASSGLTKSGTVFKLGGSLTENTNINLSGNTLNVFTGSDTARFVNNGGMNLIVKGSGTNQSVITSYFVSSTNTSNGKSAFLDYSGSLGLNNGTYESYLENANVTNPLVTLRFPNKPTGNYTIAVTSDTVNLSNRINTKLNISDTAAMLSPYLRSANITTPTLQQVTTAGNSTTDSIISRGFIVDGITTDFSIEEDGAGSGRIALKQRGGNYASVKTGNIFITNTTTNNSTTITKTASPFNFTNTLPDSSGVLTQRVAINGTTYNTAANGVVDLGNTDTATVVKAYVTNAEAVTITKGQVVYIFGASGDRASVKLAKNTSDTFSSKTLGIVRADIAAGQAGWVTTQGQVSGINLGAYSPGDILWLDSVPGGFTKIRPQAPLHGVFVGVVERANVGNGLIYIKPQNGVELEELHDTKITSPTNNQVLAYTAATDIWENKTIENILQFDTIPLAVFGAGSGAAGDTLAFSTSAVYGSFYNAGSDTLIITQMRVGVLGTSPNITTEVYWNDSLNITAGATILVTGGTSVTGTIGATNVTSFTNNKIPPNVWVFVRTSAVATKPTYFTLTLLGYRKRQ
jgi:hypothetical protein